ncbi:cilia- and flagella-associated protein 221-like isoform X2 [Corticium candelabrum]|nr:cilia- and flagella-associated protein 221-like isoform X2 [Corticium candelabrum]
MAADSSAINLRTSRGTVMERTVPNHILDTKIFSHIGKSAVAHASPSILYFSGFQPHRCYSKTLRVTNISNYCQRFHIIPPTTPHFSVKVKNKGNLVSGLSYEVKVEFRPDDYHNYHDMIRIHCQNEENVVVHVYAYPVMDSSQFPRNVTFSPTALNQSKVQVFNLKNPIPVQFEFQLQVLRNHPAFAVEPMDGVVPACGFVEIQVTFKPIDFTTAIMKLQLCLSQFNFEPVLCTIRGSSTPGLLKEQQQHAPDPETRSSVSDTESDLDPRSVTPLARTRLKRQEVRRLTKHRVEPVTSQQSKAVVYEGVRFPARLDNPSAVAAVLNQQTGKLKAKYLKSAAAGESSGEFDVQQVKEAAYEQQVRQVMADERANQLRWMTRLGDDLITDEKRQCVLQARQEADGIYKTKQRIPSATVEFNRSSIAAYISRTRRQAHDVSVFQPRFNLYENDTWGRRQVALNRFVQAARKVIVRTRAQGRLHYVQNFVSEWQRGNFSFKSKLDLALAEEQKTNKLDVVGLNTSLFVSQPFAGYLSEDEDEMPTDTSLGPCAVQPPQGQIKTSIFVPFVHISHPIEYHLLGYRALLFTTAMEYKQPGLRHELRSGAEDELAHLDGTANQQLPLIDNLLLPSSPSSQREVQESPTEDSTVSILPPPSNLTATVQYPELHIFSPVPALQRFHPMLPYSEIDDYYRFSPQPLYPTQTTREKARATTRLDLDREDVIPGFMQWKTFPCQSLVAASSVPSFSSVWLPR